MGHRLVLFVACLSVFADSFLYSIVVPLQNVYTVTYNLTPSLLGFWISSFNLSQIAAAPFVAWIMEKHGIKKTMMVGLVCTFLVTVLFAVAPYFWMLFLARCLQGVCAAFTWTGALSMPAENLPTEKQGSAIGMIMLSAGLGSSIGPVISGALYEISGESVSAPFFFFLAICIIDGAARVMLPSVAVLHDIHSHRAAAWRLLLTDQSLIQLSLMYFSIGFIFSSVEPLLPKYFELVFDIGPFYIGLLFVTMSVSFVGGSIISGYLVDYFCRYRRELILFGAVLVSITTPPLLSVTSFGVLVLFLALNGFFSAVVCIASPPEMTQVVDNHYGGKRSYGKLNAITGTCWSAGSAFGPLAISAIAEQVGSFRAVFVGSIFVIACCSLFAVFGIAFRGSTERWSAEREKLLETYGFQSASHSSEFGYELPRSPLHDSSANIIQNSIGTPDPDSKNKSDQIPIV
jgi:MFS family permease